MSGLITVTTAGPGRSSSTWANNQQLTGPSGPSRSTVSRLRAAAQSSEKTHFIECKWHVMAPTQLETQLLDTSFLIRSLCSPLCVGGAGDRRRKKHTPVMYSTVVTKEPLIHRSKNPSKRSGVRRSSTRSLSSGKACQHQSLTSSGDTAPVSRRYIAHLISITQPTSASGCFTE